MPSTLKGVGGKPLLNRYPNANGPVFENAVDLNKLYPQTTPADDAVMPFNGWFWHDDIAGTPTGLVIDGALVMKGAASAGAGQFGIDNGAVSPGDPGLWATQARGGWISAEIYSGTGTAGFDTALDAGIVGLISAYNTTLASCTNMLLLALRQESAYICYRTDDGTTDSGWVATTIPWVAGTHYRFEVFIEALNGYNATRYAYGYVSYVQTVTVNGVATSQELQVEVFRVNASLITGGLQGCAIVTRANNDELTTLNIVDLVTHGLMKN